MGSFIVYKSSAGSGKTHTLMVEYLSLALKYTTYSHILAITFTNKAANEIKQRILDNLAEIAVLSPGLSQGKQKTLIDQLCNNTGLDEDTLIINANKVLTSILHNYSDFAVSTIDSFMHRVIRSFAFDLKLSMNFEVELDTDSLINAAVDELISKTGRDEELTDLLKNYVIRQAENDENWDIRGDLRKTASALFKEKMIGLIPALESKPFTDSDFRKIFAGCNLIKNQIKNLGSEAISILDNIGLTTDDFVYGNNGVGGFIRKASQGIYADYGERTKNAIECSVWFKKGSSHYNVFADHEEKIIEIIRKVCVLQTEKKFLEIVRNNFHSTLLMKKINDELNFIRKQRNIVPVNDFNTLISGVVKEQPVPFIYLRAGEKFKHFMIDEFQDTSEMQWDNFLPLIENSLSDSRLSMIVGDGKQAIYRFKNGNAEQFVNLPSLKGSQKSPYQQGRENLLKSQYNERFLDRNYRSREEIVAFNNDFFATTAPLFIPEYSHFYPEKEVRQGFKPDNKGGMVQIDFVIPDDIIPKVLNLVNTIVGDGYKPGDIAILTRVNKDAVKIAAALQNAGIHVVSSESLLLSSSEEVNLLLNWIRLIANNEDLAAIQGIVQYMLLTGKSNRIITETRYPDRDYLFELLKSQNIEIQLRYFDSMSFYDTIEYLVRAFGLYDANPVYVRFFLDEVLRFSQGKSSGSEGFIEYWEQKSDKLSVSIPKSKDSVQILTVHKSKGLDFPVVIYAFPDQKKDMYDLSWANIKIDVPVASEREEIHMPLVYKFGSEQTDTPLENEYLIEKARMNLDKFNLYYVAFTRASERLYVVLEEINKSVDTPARLNELVKVYLERNNLGRVFGNGNKVNGWYFDSEDKDAQSTVITINTKYDTADWHQKLIISKRSPSEWGIYEDQESSQKKDKPDEDVLSAIEYGKLVHKIFSQADDLKDVRRVIAETTNGGSDREETLNKRLSSIVDQLEMLPESSYLFSKGSIISEKEIITSDGETYRPDRVIVRSDSTIVIDFKTGQPVSKHQEQVLFYLNLIEKMNYPKPCGYIVYLGNEVKIEEVIKKEEAFLI